MGSLTFLLLALNIDLYNVIVYTAMAFGGLVVIYALYIFYLMAVADDANKRAEAKKRAINSVSIILILVALISLLKILQVRTNGQDGWYIEVSGGTLIGTRQIWGLELKYGGGGQPKDYDDVRKAARFDWMGGVRPGRWDISMSPTGPALATVGFETPPLANKNDYSPTATIQCTIIGGKVVKTTLYTSYKPPS